MIDSKPKAPDIFPWGFKNKPRAQVPATTDHLLRETRPFKLIGACPLCGAELTVGMTVTLALTDPKKAKARETFYIAGTTIVVVCTDQRHESANVRLNLSIVDGDRRHLPVVSVNPSALPPAMRKELEDQKGQKTPLGQLMLPLQLV